MKMVVAWHDAAFTLPDAILTPEVMRQVLDKFHLQHKLKETWSRDEAMVLGKLTSLDETSTGSMSMKDRNQNMIDSQETILESIR
jgi:hypothetical protein